MGEIEIGDFIVEWDDAKAAINKKKHNVTFEMAALVFLDEFLIDCYDENHSDDEDRIKVIGKVAKILVVIYTERGEKYRLISARLANKREEDEYYGQFDS
ncbi:MAG: BrnT family toxin [Selenomonadaceae bacterium]|nr:BrnT family toxin [Selenomonadaceae bacterium]